MTRIAVCADLHVDAYYSRIDAETGLNARELDFLETTGWVAAKARALDAEVLVVAGDYTESKVPARGPRIARIARALQRGPDRQIHLRGNHDSEQAGDSIVSVLAGYPGWSGYMRPGFELVGDVAICAIPYLDRRWARTVPDLVDVPDADLFRVLGEQYLALASGLFVEAERAGAKSAVLVGHQQLAGAAMTDSQRSFLGDVDLVVDARALAAIGYAAIVFGHVHRAQTVVEPLHPDTEVLFAGSIERVDFAEEHEEKSFVLLDVTHGRGGGRIVNLERIPTPARRFVTVDAEAWPQAPGDVGGPASGFLDGAIVRVVNVPPEDSVDDVRKTLEELGAFAVTTVKRRQVDGPEREASAIADAGGPDEQLAAYFDGDPDAPALVDRGRELLAEVGS